MVLHSIHDNQHGSGINLLPGYQICGCNFCGFNVLLSITDIQDPCNPLFPCRKVLSTLESILNSQLHGHSEVYLSNPRSGSLGLCLPIDLPLIYCCCWNYLSFSSLELLYHVNFPLIFKLGLTVHARSLLITTHEYLLQYVAEYKTEK